MKSIKELDEKLSIPSRDLIEDLSAIDGDILILGAGGKMGPSLAMLAKNAVDQLDSSKEIILSLIHI